MFLHLGGDRVIMTRDIIAVLNAKGTHLIKDLGKSAVRDGPEGLKAEETKSFVITTAGVYPSRISAGTLKKRAGCMVISQE